MIALQYPWDPPPPKPDKPAAQSPRRARGRPPGQPGHKIEPGWLGPRIEAGQGAVAPDPANLRQVMVTDWLYHRLTVSGPDDQVAAFANAAAGAGVVPWRLDFAKQFREKVEARQAKALALVGTSRACPFDLHVLLPVPARVLALGPDDPAAEAWLMTHWGTTELRQVTVLPPLKGRSYLPPGRRALRLGFFSANWSPWPALRTLRKTWPALRLMLQPVYELG